MKKTLRVDTSVLIFDPNCFANKKFENCDIIIPIQVLEELDKLKKGVGEAAKNARVSIRYLDSLGDINQGVKLENKALLKVESNDYGKIGEDAEYNDNKILACAFLSKKKNKVLLSRDINLRVRARSLGILAEDYIEVRKTTEEFYSGIKILKDDTLIQEIMENGFLDLKDKKIDLYPNQCVIFKDSNGYEALSGRRVENKIKVVKKTEIWGITSKNTEQQLAMDLLMDPNIPLVSLIGHPGAGKTLLALASALELVINRRKFNKLIIYRPIQVVGNQEVGFLPGSLLEKIINYFGSILDSFEVLSSNSADKNGKKSKAWMDNLEMFMDRGLIEFESLGFLRGRSINNSIMLLDDCQNFSIDDIKTVLTRVGNGTRVFLTGDPLQIDTRGLDIENNAITYAAELFKNSKLAGHITLTETHRSALATEAIKLFK